MNESLRHQRFPEAKIINRFLGNLRELPEVRFAERFTPRLDTSVFVPNAYSHLHTDRLLREGKQLRLYLHISPSEQKARQALESVLDALNVDGSAILPTLAGRRWVILDASGNPDEQIKIFRRVAEMAARMCNVSLVKKSV